MPRSGDTIDAFQSGKARITGFSIFELSRNAATARAPGASPGIPVEPQKLSRQAKADAVGGGRRPARLRPAAKPLSLKPRPAAGATILKKSDPRASARGSKKPRSGSVSK